MILAYGSMDLWYASAVIGGAAVGLLMYWGRQHDE